MPSGSWTTAGRSGSVYLIVVLCAACGAGPAEPPGEPRQAVETPAQPTAAEPGSPPQTKPAARSSAEAHLGVVDRGIFSDLDQKVQIPLPAELGEARAVIDPARKLLVLYRKDWPIKVYPVGGPAELAVGETTLALRPGDRAELAPLLTAGRVRSLEAGEAPAPGDADKDGIPDPLDVLIGGKKTVLDAAPYGGQYMVIDYPNGDIPRGMGVCTDVIIRAARNAGFDLQSALQRDIRAARRSYPMVKRPNANIDHRRVKTILPYFVRHWDRRKVELDAKDDPLRPGDVVFMDTFPSKSGPDQIGPSGLPLVINSWTDGFRTSEMDLLSFVPVTHRFRFPSK
jgi:uncharacterized protein YijF (DUF1287 family)